MASPNVYYILAFRLSGEGRTNLEAAVEVTLEGGPEHFAEAVVAISVYFHDASLVTSIQALVYGLA